MARQKKDSAPAAGRRAEPRGRSARGNPAPAGADSDPIDRELAESAIRRRKNGRGPTAREAAALRRSRKAREEELLEDLARRVPQKKWREWSGRQTKTLHEQAARYRLPIGGRLICVPDLAAAIHDFLARNERRLNAPETEDDMLAGENSPALERYREEKARIERIKRLELERQVVRRTDLEHMLGRLASLIRAAGETLRRQHGPDAHQVLEEAIDDFEGEVEKLFGDGEDSDDQPGHG